MQRIDFGTALPVILEAHPHRQREQIDEAFLERRVAGDLAADVADHAPQPNAQEPERPPGPFELVCMRVAPDHDRSSLGDAPVALPQRHIVASRQIDQFSQRAVAQPCIGRMGNRFGLHRGVDHDPFEIAGRQRPGLVRHRQALLDQRHQRLLAEPLAPMRQGRAVERQPVAEAQLTAKELVIRVLQPARAQHFVRQIVHVLQDKQPRHQTGRQAGLARTRRADAGKALIEKPPIDLTRQPHQRMAQIDDLLQCRP
jgi:hypothetical protein